MLANLLTFDKCGGFYWDVPGRPSRVLTAAGACGSVNSRTLNTAPL
jgi:hypothetical protein